LYKGPNTNTFFRKRGGPLGRGREGPTKRESMERKNKGLLQKKRVDYFEKKSD